jgi:hypothetical protein
MLKDKETRNTFRFASEDGTSGIPTIYVSKEICFAMGDPEEIVITVSVAK